MLFEMNSSAAMRSPVRPRSASGSTSASRLDSPNLSAMAAQASSNLSASRTITDRALKSRSVNRNR